jgi:mRNA interferase MazF
MPYSLTQRRKDPKTQRRQGSSRFSTVICAPVYSVHDGLASQVPVGADEGLKHDSSIHCGELVSLPKSALTDFVGTLSPAVVRAMNEALKVAPALAEPP